MGIGNVELHPRHAESVWHFVTHMVEGNRFERRHGKYAKQVRKEVRAARKKAMRERRDAATPRLVQFHF